MEIAISLSGPDDVRGCYIKVSPAELDLISRYLLGNNVQELTFQRWIKKSKEGKSQDIWKSVEELNLPKMLFGQQGHHPGSW